MKQPLGNILPTRQTIKDANKYHAERVKLAEDKAKELGFKNGQYEQGKTRYYISPDEYIVISLQTLKPLRFIRKGNGFFVVKY